MPKIKRLLKRCEIELAKRVRTCRSTKKSILKDTKCVVVYDSQYKKHTYSSEAAFKMIQKARKDLDELEQLLDEPDLF